MLQPKDGAKKKGKKKSSGSAGVDPVASLLDATRKPFARSAVGVEGALKWIAGWGRHIINGRLRIETIASIKNGAGASRLNPSSPPAHPPVASYPTHIRSSSLGLPGVVVVIQVAGRIHFRAIWHGIRPPPVLGAQTILIQVRNDPF